MSGFYVIGPAATFDAANSEDGGELVVQRVAPYCDAPQRDASGRGIVQRFTREAAEKMADAFNGSIRRLLDKLPFASASLPCYNGHPDHADGGASDEARDTEIYARVERLEAREDGLWATLRKYPRLEALKAALGRLEISPRWLCEDAGNGVFVPFRLISLGFVKRGNLPGADVINSIQTDSKIMNEEQLMKLAEILGIEKEAAKADPSALVAAVAELKSKISAPAAANDEGGCEGESSAKSEDEKKDEEKAVAAANASALAYAIESKLTEAVANGRITEAQRGCYRALLKSDFVNACKALDALSGTLNSGAGLAAKAAAADAANRAQAAKDANAAFAKLTDLVNAAQAKLGCSFAEAQAAVLGTAEGRDLYSKTI